MNKTKHGISLLLLLILFASQAVAQLVQPVKWSFEQKKISDTEFDLIANATIDNGWHLYGMYFEDGGPNPTTVVFTPNASAYELIGKVKQVPEPHTKVDEVFEITIQEFSGKASFVQRIKLKSATNFAIQVTIEGQACMDDGVCVLTDAEHSFTLKGVPAGTGTKAESKIEKQPETQKTDQPKATEKTNAPSENSTINSVDPATDADSLTDANANTIQTAETVDPTPEVNSSNQTVVIDTQQIRQEAKDVESGESLFGIFWLSFLAGLVALLTPCVFPMIPMTVSFFMGGEKNKAKARLQALVYGFSIVGIYTIIGTIVAITLGPEFANWLSTHWIPNVFFFLIFIFFAASFLGMFEIVLPSWIVNKADAQADKGGFLGAFFMAFTLVLVSFSCTGPIVGSILVQSATGASIKPIIGMFGFSLAFAFPFTFFAFSPGLLKSLPKSGGWLNSVKVVLGFVEIALGLKFLSVADQTYHWGILDREIYIALWIVIFFLLGLYFLGKLQFSHDSKPKFLSVPSLFLSILTFTFVVYLLPGMFGAPLKALSGYLPPMASHDFDLSAQIREAGGGGNHSNAANKLCGKPKYSDFLHLPHGLEGYYDFEEGIACAKQQNKPIFIDFTGHGCVNCREMEANVWSDPAVLKRLREEFIIIALYVDDKTDLPEKEWVLSSFDQKYKKTIGKKYADFQITNFGVNAQPYYVLLDTNGKPLVTPKAYDKTIPNFIKFLDAGIAEFKKRQE